MSELKARSARTKRSGHNNESGAREEQSHGLLLPDAEPCGQPLGKPLGKPRANPGQTPSILGQTPSMRPVERQEHVGKRGAHGTL